MGMLSPKDKARIISGMKRGFSRSETYKAVLESALAKKTGPKGGKMYKCKKCRKAYSRHLVQVDHIHPVIPVGQRAQEMTLDAIAERLYTTPDRLQVLCKSCHAKKTLDENTERKANARKTRRKGNTCTTNGL